MARLIAGIGQFTKSMMATGPSVYVVLLDENDVPGARLQHSVVEQHSNEQLKRWLECRGLPRTGVRKDLVERVRLTLLQPYKIDPSVDEGLWYQRKLHAFVREGIGKGLDNVGLAGPSQSSQSGPSLTPEPLVWENFKFSRHQPPTNFNYGHIYHHIVESVQAVDFFAAPMVSAPETLSSDSESESLNVTDLHTSKPLTKGEMYFKSGHVQDMLTSVDHASYKVKSNVMASFKMKVSYNVMINVSPASGYIQAATCNCKASAMGRCSHVAALLFAVLDFKNKFDHNSPTSDICSWNQGRKKDRDPKKLSDTTYNTVKGKDMKTSLSTFDPRPPSYREELNQQDVNNFITDLQYSGSRSGMSSTMWEKILQLKYPDYTLTTDEEIILKDKCNIFLSNVSAKDFFSECKIPLCLVLKQGTESWHAERSVRITASKCKAAFTASTDSAISNFLLETMWNTSKPFSNAAMRYGNENEPLARQLYTDMVAGKFTVVETGLWINPKFPELACSPDGLVISHMNPTEMSGILEIKCPYILKDKNPANFETLLTKGQLTSFCLELNNGQPTMKPNHPYYFQIQLQMAITERDWCDFMIYTGSKYYPLIVRITKNEEFCNNLVSKCVSFHHTYMCAEKFEMRVPRQLSPYKLNL